MLFRSNELRKSKSFKRRTSFVVRNLSLSTDQASFRLDFLSAVCKVIGQEKDVSESVERRTTLILMFVAISCEYARDCRTEDIKEAISRLTGIIKYCTSKNSDLFQVQILTHFKLHYKSRFCSVSSDC